MAKLVFWIDDKGYIRNIADNKPVYILKQNSAFLLDGSPAFTIDSNGFIVNVGGGRTLSFKKDKYIYSA